MRNIFKNYSDMKPQKHLTAKNLAEMFLGLCLFVNLNTKMTATAEQILSIGTYEKAKEYCLSQKLDWTQNEHRLSLVDHLYGL